MFVDLCKRANAIDDCLSIIMNVDEGIYSLGVYAEGIGTIYSYSSTDLPETFEKVNRFIDCLTDKDKFKNLFNEVQEMSLGE